LLQANWNDADAYCRLTGRELLSIRNDLEQDDIEIILSRANLRGNVWLSGFCFNSEWTWSSDLAKVNRLFNRLENYSIFCGSTSDNLMMYGPYAPSQYKFQWRQESPVEANYFICKSDGY